MRAIFSKPDATTRSSTGAPHPRLALASTAALLFASFSLSAADTAQLMHDALKERWYTTELIVFRTTASGATSASEATLLEGEKLSVAQEREQHGMQPELLETEEDGPDDEQLDGPGKVPAEVNPEKRRTVRVLTDPNSDSDTNSDTNSDNGLVDSAIERPELDAQPWERIKDYDGADDLGELVARNMATWETQLRSREGEWLTPEELTLVDAASRLARRSNVEILLHSAWTQAVPDRESGQPIKIATDDIYLNPVTQELESRLSGRVTVTLGRYLHVQPTLFYTPQLATANPTAGTLDSGADQLQHNNLNQQESLIVAQARAAAAAARGESVSNTRTATNGRRVPDVRDLSSNADTPGSSRRSALDRLRDKETAMRTTGTDRSLNSAGSRADLETERPPYIRLDESRRVRSGELHYLDHPQLGVLVRITPVVADPLLQEQFALLQ